jgi:hypothetical protein
MRDCLIDQPVRTARAHTTVVGKPDMSHLQAYTTNQDAFTEQMNKVSLKVRGLSHGRRRTKTRLSQVIWKAGMLSPGHCGYPEFSTADW